MRHDDDDRSRIGPCGTEEVARIQQGGVDEPPMIKTRAMSPIAAYLLVQARDGRIPVEATRGRKRQCFGD